MGGLLVSKLVKPTKVFCSRTAHQSGIDQVLFSQTQSKVRASDARVLRKSDAAVGQELGGLNPSHGVFDQLTEFIALLIGDCGTQVLNLN